MTDIKGLDGPMTDQEIEEVEKRVAVLRDDYWEAMIPPDCEDPESTCSDGGQSSRVDINNTRWTTS